MPIVASEFLGSERCIGVGTEIFNVFVLISYRCWKLSFALLAIVLDVLSHLLFEHYSTLRINKHGSQKDQEQKKNGNYFFYDAEEAGGDEDDDDFDDI